MIGWVEKGEYKILGHDLHEPAEKPGWELLYDTLNIEKALEDGKLAPPPEKETGAGNWMTKAPGDSGLERSGARRSWMDLPELPSDWMSPVPAAAAQLERRTPTKGQVVVDPDATTTEKSSDAMDVIKQVASAAEPILMNIVIPLAQSTIAYLFPKLHAEVQQCEKHLKRLGESLLLSNSAAPPSHSTFRRSAVHPGPRAPGESLNAKLCGGEEPTTVVEDTDVETTSTDVEANQETSAEA